MTDESFRVQQAGFLLEFSSDWIVLRATENVHRFLGEYHVRMIGEPLANFTLAQPLHDLRNSLSRQRSSNGIARAYRVRLTDSPMLLDIVFQQVDGRFILEGMPSSNSFGAALGTVSRMIDGLASCDAAGVARRMRALCGFDRVLLVSNEGKLLAECSRSKSDPRAIEGWLDLPPIVGSLGSETVALNPRSPDAGATAVALLRAPTATEAATLKELGIKSMLNVPVFRDGQRVGLFSCDSHTVIEPSFELHAAAELFAQVYAMQVES